MTRRWIWLISLALVMDCSVTAIAQGPGSAGHPPEGCQPCVASVRGGQVDWYDGFIIAEGKGKADGRTEQDKLSARRVAETVALRNALLLAMDIQIDAEGRIADLRNAEIALQGTVKGHQTIAEDWLTTPLPEVVVKVRVPLWGAEGAAAIVYDGEVKKSLSGARRRVVLADSRLDVSDAVLIIDARKTGVRPCLFPAVTAPDGAVVYDVGTVASRQKQAAPTVRYVETTLTHTQLRAGLSGLERPVLACFPVAGEDAPAFPIALSSTEPLQARLYLALPEPPRASQPATGGPASHPASKPAEASRRRKVVKAAEAAGRASTEIVLTREDVDKLSQDPEGAALLRSGRVIIVVDSVAAGIQGQRPIVSDEDSLARRWP